MNGPIKHGQIIGGVITTPDIDTAIADYRDTLGMSLLSDGLLSDALAASWNCPAAAGARMATLQPESGAHCFIRLVEQPDHPDFKPTTTYGWAAYEMSVQDVFGWPKRLDGSGFDIIGPPKELAGMPYFVPMQVHGRGREMIYLNEVRENMPGSDLPKAQSPVDQIFICILAARDRAGTVKWYAEKLGLDAADTFTLAYSMINKAFGLRDDFMTDLTMVQAERMTILEVDDYPEQAAERPRHDGMLPPGNALVTLAINNLDGLEVDWIAPPVERPEMLYGARRAATTIGPAGELLELVEMS